MPKFYSLRLVAWLIAGLLLLTAHDTIAQTASKVDSLKHALTTATDTTRVKLLYALKTQMFNNNYPEALEYAREGLAESRRLGWEWGEAQGLEHVGQLIWRTGNLAQAQEHMFAALTLWRKLRREDRIARNAFFISGFLRDAKQFDKANEWGIRALNGARAARDTSGLVRSYSSLASICSEQGQHFKALSYYQQALALALAQRQRKVDSTPEAMLHNNVADVYIELNQPQKALPHLFRAIRLARNANNKFGAGFYETTLAQAYSKLGKPAMAIYHARIAHKLSSRTESLSLLIAINNLLNTLYVQQGNYRLAHRALVENLQLESQVRLQEQERKVAELQGRYDTKEKERSIQLLTQQNRIAQLAALQQRTLRNAAIVTAALLLLAVGVLVNRYRLRQRTVRLLDAQNQEKTLLLEEKTLLLQEVHHRVKNNLQIVLSLLSNQLDALDARADPAVAASLRDSQSRVQTMALIHQNLYQSESLARVDMRRYLAELLEAIGGTFRHADVAVALDVAPVQLTPHTAVPLGLIVNELVTNAYKYAFAGRAHGNRLRVALRPAGAGALCLEVADNGPGLPALDLAVVQSLGLRLAAGLARQMQAQLTVRREGGTCFSLTFRELPAAGAEPAPAPGEAVSSVYMRV